MANKYRLKGHGGFIMREGWFTKGLQKVEQNPNLFSAKYNGGTDALGIGSAMTKAVKYWLLASGLVEEKRGIGCQLTDFGKLVLTYDKYIEQDFTIWLLHYNIVLQKEKATLWNLFFTTIPFGEYSREKLIEKMRIELELYVGDEDISDRSFYDDCNTLFQMYSDEVILDDPEDKKHSIFSHLGMLRKSYKGFIREKINTQLLPKEVMAIAVMNCLQKEESIDELLKGKYSLGTIFSIGRIEFNEYLDKIAELGYIQVNRTAGLDRVHIKNANTSQIEIIEEYYRSQQ